MEPQQGMTPEEKAAVMQLMGQTYGQIHKQDQMIVGDSSNLTPSSNLMKEVFEQTAQIPTVQQSQQPVANVPVPKDPEPLATVTPEQAVQEINETVNSSNQMEFDLSEPSKFDKMLDLLKEQNLLLKDISLKLDNGKNFKTKKQD